MELFEAIHSRRSIRKYLDLDVEWIKIADILEAGRAAPKAGNISNIKYVLVREKKRKASIANCCLQQYWIAAASVIIVVVDIPDRQTAHYGEAGKAYSAQGSAAAIQNMLLAANALGLGACWVGAFEEEMIKRELKIAASGRVQAVIPIGYPNETPVAPSKTQLQNEVRLEDYASKIEYPELVTRHYSKFWKKKISRGKGYVENKGGKAYESVKPHIEKAKKFLKKIKRESWTD